MTAKDVRCHHCGKTWRDSHPDQPGAEIWCGDCARVHKPIDPEVIGDMLERHLFTDDEIQARRSLTDDHYLSIVRQEDSERLEMAKSSAMTQSIVDEYLATLEAELQAMYRKAADSVRSRNDTLSEEFQLVAGIVDVFEKRAKDYYDFHNQD